MSNQKTIIVKKIKKHGGGGHHGGSWKVAYADFVTAMMAFFLLLWLLNMSSPEKRVRLSYYFKYFSIFSQSGTSFMSKSSEMFSESGQTREKVFMDTPTDKRKVSNEKSKDNENPPDDGADTSDGSAYLKGMEKALKQIMVDNLGDLKDQVLVDTVEDGIRIQMIDKDGSDMFELGSSRLTPKAKEILNVIGQNISKLPNRIIIEGHTDALPFSGSDYSNWELSTERASSARKELEANGLDPERIMRVAGYADKDPLIKENPADPRNRRISIILKVPTGKEKNGKKAKLPALVIPGQTPASNGASERMGASTEKRWNTVTGREHDVPVKNNSWGPVINNKWSPVLKKDFVTGNGWGSADTEKKTGSTGTKNMERLSAATEDNNKNLNSQTKPSAKEQWKPVMKDNTWAPVFKKDKWDPVLNRD